MPSLIICVSFYFFLKICIFIINHYSSLIANTELFSNVWDLLFPAIQKALIHRNCLFTKSYRLVCIFLCYQNKHRANILHQRGPIPTCLSEGLLIFNNWFGCFHPVQTNICSYLTNQILMRNTHAIEKMQGLSPACYWTGDSSQCL